jgi:hypothetical protein
MVRNFPIGLILACMVVVGCETKESASPPATPLESPPPAAVKAGVGVGQQGRSLDGDTGVQQMISAPVSAFFKAKERIAFDVQVPHAVNLFRATEGRLPKNHEEFMEKIIQANQIPLPKLPEGMIYRFHPDSGELWVHPSNETQAGGASSTAPQQ